MKSLLFPVFFLSLFLSGTAPSPTPQATTKSVGRQGAVAGPIALGDLRKFLKHMAVIEVDDGMGGTYTTIQIHDANLQIVNGSGATDGLVDGLGNLIVGYNELRGAGDDRSGSHNLVVGKEHNFSSFGGLVAGFSNTVSGNLSSVSGGRFNTASGDYSWVSGGTGNQASGLVSSVSGGLFNTASGPFSSVSGGGYNTASQSISSVSGGRYNIASGTYSSVSGGQSNTASGDRSSVSGGNGRSALDIFDWVAGALFQDN